MLRFKVRKALRISRITPQTSFPGYCGEAYVALADHPKREDVAQQAFNLSNGAYETVQAVGGALARSYGLTLKLRHPATELPKRGVHALANFSQWVGSDKIRGLTGWKERRPTFVEAIEEFRLAYEASSIPKP